MVAFVGSILGPLLFNINLIVLFSKCEDTGFKNYADSATPYASCLWRWYSHFWVKKPASKLFMWFENNHIKGYLEKSHLLNLNPRKK